MWIISMGKSIASRKKRIGVSIMYLLLQRRVFARRILQEMLLYGPRI